MVNKTGKFNVIGEIGRHYGRHDLDRVGFFDDSPSGPFDKYLRVRPTARNDFKGKQLLAGQPNGLFEKTFKRIFNGEVLPAPAAKRRVDISGRGQVMLPPSPAKLHSTPNDWFGCIGKPPSYFSPEVKKSKDMKGKKKYEYLAPPNFKIKPNPLGGPGYIDICLSHYPKHASEPYDVKNKNGEKARNVSGGSTAGKFLTASAPLDYFPPNPYVDRKPGPTYVHPANRTLKTPSRDTASRFYVPFPKHPGGQHAGCFNKFPGFLNDPYQDKIKNKKIAGPKFFAGGPNVRLKYTNSIINQVTSISCNAKNYRVYRERVYPLPS